jgi:nucleoprotein TPR
MSDAEVLGGNKAGPSSDTEIQSNFASSSQPVARKRVAPISTSELREESVAPGEKSSDVIAPVLKKPKGSESPEESGEEQQPATTPEFGSSYTVAEESFESGELPQGQNEEVSEAQNDDETAVGKDEDSKDPPNLDGTSQEEIQADKTGTSEENLDQPAETKIISDEMQRDLTEIDNQQSTLPLSSETEEGELLQEAGDPEGGCDASNTENQESREATPEPSPARGDDDALEAGEINSPEVSSDDKNDEGDLVEDAADGSEKLVDNEPAPVESDPVAEPAPVASESNLQSSVVESSSSKLPVSKQATTSAPSKTEEVKPSSPISDTSTTTINLTERAREMAKLRQAGQAGPSVFTTAGRGRGRAPRGRVIRGRGRRPPSSDA